MVASLGVSLVYARYKLPLIAERWLTLKDAQAADKADEFMGRLTRRYERGAARAFARPGMFVDIAAAMLAVIGFVSWDRVQSGFMPRMDEGGFILDYKAKSGAALSDTDRLLRQVERSFARRPRWRAIPDAPACSSAAD